MMSKILLCIVYLNIFLYFLSNASDQNNNPIAAAKFYKSTKNNEKKAPLLSRVISERVSNSVSSKRNAVSELTLSKLKPSSMKASQFSLKPVNEKPIKSLGSVGKKNQLSGLVKPDPFRKMDSSVIRVNRIASPPVTKTVETPKQNTPITTSVVKPKTVNDGFVNAFANNKHLLRNRNTFTPRDSSNKKQSSSKIKATRGYNSFSTPYSTFSTTNSLVDSVSKAGSYLSSYISSGTQIRETSPGMADITRHKAYHKPARISRSALSIFDNLVASSVSGPTRNTTNSFNLTAVTWNLAEHSPTLKDCRFLTHFAHDDFLVLGVQECEAIKPRRTDGRRSRRWRDLRTKTLRKTHTCLVEHRFGGMQLAVHCHKRVRDLVEGVQIVEVPCGVGNVLSNKGAIAMLVRLKGDKTLLLVNCHLAAHDKLTKQRNKDFHRIVNAIADQACPEWKAPRVKRKKVGVKALKRSGSNDTKRKRTKAKTKTKHLRGSSLHTITTSNRKHRVSRPLNETFDAVVFMGDFNYRLDVTRSEVDRLQDKYNKLVKSNLNTNASNGRNNLNNSTILTIPQDMRYTSHPHINTTSPAFKSFHDQLECVLDLDQLSTERSAGRVFRGCREGEILFPPTYKYDKRSSDFDSSHKMRCPAWTDRILYAERNNESNSNSSSSSGEVKPALKLTNYLSVDIRSSDHRPVCGQFDVNL